MGCFPWIGSFAWMGMPFERLLGNLRHILLFGTCLQKRRVVIPPLAGKIHWTRKSAVTKIFSMYLP